MNIPVLIEAIQDAIRETAADEGVDALANPRVWAKVTQLITEDVAELTRERDNAIAETHRWSQAEKRDKQQHEDELRDVRTWAQATIEQHRLKLEALKEASRQVAENVHDVCRDSIGLDGTDADRVLAPFQQVDLMPDPTLTAARMAARDAVEHGPQA